MFVVVSYDIKDNKRRNRVLKLLKNYGQRIQYSVFECDLKISDYQKMRTRLERVIKKEEDSIRFYFLCEKDVSKIQRCGGIKPLPSNAIIV